jgi:hypothetical protein
MADYEDEFDFDSNDLAGSDLVKQLRKQVNELSKALKDRDEQLEDYYEMSREQEIAEVLSEAGIDPRIAAFVPDDVEDVDDLAEWLGEYGDVFNISVSDEGEEQELQEGDELYLDPELIQAAEQMSAIEDGGVDPLVGQTIEQMIESARTPEELQAILKG